MAEKLQSARRNAKLLFWILIIVIVIFFTSVVIFVEYGLKL